ncbi:MAG: lipid-A-disaccharide synthase [Alphaproteobacteria bacterium]|nr:lipid-A-disaccharide synthase [Alphaproteobacteria bacterium]
MPESPLFFLIAGEASGDLLGARLMRSLKNIHPDARFAGIGGLRMQEEGIELLFPQEELAHFGLFELLRHIPNILRRMKQTVEEIRYRKPDALITIDAPDFCFRVARRLKGEGIPLIHYVAPTVWVWRKGRAKKIARFLDHLMVLLPFEPPYFTKEGLDTTFVGHSIIESGADKGDAQRFRHNHGIPAKATLLTVLPGSRKSEISRLMPIFEKTVERLQERHPNLHVILPTIPSLSEDLKERTQDWPVPVTIVESDADKYDAFAASRAALACSGTVSIELAMARLPSVTAYKVSLPTILLYGLFVMGTYANLVNIMHKRMVVPELLQFNCTPKKLAEAADALLTSEAARQKQIEGLAEVAGWLTPGSKPPSQYAAETVDHAVKWFKLPS